MDDGNAAHVGLALWGTESVQARVAHAAEAAGFESVWLVDSQLICRELCVTLAACAAAASRLRLARDVTVPSTRDPALDGPYTGSARS